MKAEEHTRQVRDEVVEKYKAGLGYTKLSQALNISQSSVQSIIRKWKKYSATAYLPGHGRPHKRTGQARRAFNQRSSQDTNSNCRDPKLRWENLSTGQLIVVHSTNLDFFGRVGRRKPLLKESHKKSHLWEAMWGTQQSCGRRCSG